jgi:hypothetical protein
MVVLCAQAKQKMRLNAGDSKNETEPLLGFIYPELKGAEKTTNIGAMV